MIIERLRVYERPKEGVKKCPSCGAAAKFAKGPIKFTDHNTRYKICYIESMACQSCGYKVDIQSDIYENPSGL